MPYTHKQRIYFAELPQRRWKEEENKAQTKRQEKTLFIRQIRKRSAELCVFSKYVVVVVVSFIPISLELTC